MDRLNMCITSFLYKNSTYNYLLYVFINIFNNTMMIMMFYTMCVKYYCKQNRRFGNN